MTRKDFELIASVIRGHQDGGDEDVVLRGLALSLSVEFKKNNPRFNRARFIQSCLRVK